MKLAFLLALMISQTALAATQSRNDAATAEAVKFLIPCSRYTGDDAFECRTNHANFIEDFIGANAGKADYIHDLARFFSTAPDMDDRRPPPGIRRDRKAGCAWLLTEAVFTPNAEARSRIAVQLHDDCIDFTAQDNLAIWLRATDLVGEIRAHPTIPPKPYIAPNGANLITKVPSD
jgi:hypothetical protein